MIVELIIGLVIVAGLVLYAAKHRKAKNENPEASATGLPMPEKPKRDSPN